MTTIRFNAITYANKLKKAKDNNELADIQAEELSNVVNNDLATKQDIQILKQDIDKLKMELQAFIVRAFLMGIGAIGGLQALLHFLKP